MTSHPAVTAPRFEHHREALGIGDAAPRLSWVVTSAPEGWQQTGHRLEQRDSAGTTTSASAPSGDSVLVAWPFAPLASRERREVRVQVVGRVPGGAEQTASEWSPWAPVEAGLLSSADWSARMVGPADDAVAAPLLRGGFQVRDAPVRRARVYATAHGVYELEVNGVRVGDHELAPGWSAYESRLRYATHDVTALLVPGANAVGVRLADGWWRGHLGWDGRRALYGDQLGVLVQLEVEHTDGQRQVVGTDETWTAGSGAVLAGDLYDGEHFDARLEDPAWSTAAGLAGGRGGGGWAPVVLRDLDTAVLVAPDGPPVRVTEVLSVQEVITTPSGKTVLDFGQNLVGRLRLRVRGQAGDTVVLRHAEVLEHGELATEPLRGAKATDTYVLRGGELEEWAPRTTFHGFRYAEVTGWPGRLDPADVVAEVLHTDSERTGWFTASDARVDRLHQNAVWGWRGNTVDVPTDCPQRDERLGWTGDLQVFAPTATFLYDSAGFLGSWLKDLAAEQQRYQGTPMVVPAITTGHTGPMAGWADAATVVPWVLYQAHGDLGVLEQQFPSMVAWVEEVTAAAGPDRLWSAGFQFGDWLDPTAPPGRPEAAKTYPEIVATAYFARSAQIVADAAALLGREDDAARFAALAAQVRSAFHDEYVSRSGRLLSDSPTAYALALVFDLLETDDERRRAADRLAELVRGDQYRIATGFIGTPLVCDALSAHGHADVAYRLLLNTEAPSWLYAVEHGATTIWERWDSLLPDGTVNPSGMTSFNHYALGAVADWMHRVVAGLGAAAPGYRRLRIAPQPPRRGLTSASARLRTPYGEAASAWELADGQLHLTVTVPVGATAEVLLPSGATHEVGSGEHAFTEAFEVDPEQAPAVTVDTPLGVLVDRPEAMAVLLGVITKHVPEAAEHMSGGLRGQEGVTPRQVAAMLPHSDAVLDDLERGFAAVSAGREVPADVLTRSEPATGGDHDDDGLEAAAALLTGADFWTTRAGEGVRPLVLVDGPHGVRRQREGQDHLGIYDSEPATCFPTGAAIASSWDTDLVAEVAGALGREARALDVDVLLGPGVNIKRSPLGGRGFEYFSEDPRLSGALGTAWVQGLQATGVGASLKHFAVNNQETDRMRVSAEVDERTLREIYLPAFEHVVTQARPATVMSAYNAVNGVFCSENRWLLTDVLRGEWGFDGLVVSDWGAIKDRVEALAAGLDLEMPSSGDDGTAAIVAAVRAGRLDRSVVDAAVARLARLGERTAPGAASTAVEPVDHEAHHALARRAGAESVVLLRNEGGVLPLRAGQRVAVLGRFAVEPQFQGGGSSHVKATRVDAPLDALVEALGADAVQYAAGYPERGATDPGTAEALLEEAAALAAGGTAVVVVGLDEADQSEGFDRTDLELPASHVALVQRVAAVADRTVVVLLNGGVVTLEPWHDAVDAVVEAWSLGQAVGGAVADVLTGAVNPSGRLAETIPLRLADTPSYLSFPGEHEVVRYGEGLFTGYRGYTAADRPVRYAFGHGLSYTTFEQTDLVVEATGPVSATVRLRVRNTGAVAGAEVVQVYVAPAPSAVRRPVRELVAFAKVHLRPGEERTVELELGRRAFAHWDVTRHDWLVVGGTYEVQLGRSAVDVVAAAPVALDGDAEQVEPLTLESTVKQWFAHPVVGPVLISGLTSAGGDEQDPGAVEKGLDMLRMIDSMSMGQFARMPMVGISDEQLEQLMTLSSAPLDAEPAAAAPAGVGA